MRDISVNSLADSLACDPPSVVVLDVREPWECELAGLTGAMAVPMNQVPARLDELTTAIDGGRDLAVICHSGVRSRHVAQFLEQNGFSDVLNVAGGIDAWSREVDPAVPRY